ncbi:BrnA antitoxin family protein [Desulfonatronum thioautotrophicum]|uniref:BrnA antitoxin family protein n=1 Tax=Desulfonatronum thioautotrophicum TaxID=617001 RepID=UPI00338EA0EB
MLRAETESASFPRAKPAKMKGMNTMRSEYDFGKAKRGPVIQSPGKTRITIMLDDDVIEHFRQQAEIQGIGYQTMINAALRRAVAVKRQEQDDPPLTIATLRQVIREELHAS